MQCNYRVWQEYWKKGRRAYRTLRVRSTFGRWKVNASQRFNRSMETISIQIIETERKRRNRHSVAKSQKETSQRKKGWFSKTVSGKNETIALLQRCDSSIDVQNLKTHLLKATLYCCCHVVNTFRMQLFVLLHPIDTHLDSSHQTTMREDERRRAGSGHDRSGTL